LVWARIENGMMLAARASQKFVDELTLQAP
jgi:hypothetical protein